MSYLFKLCWLCLGHVCVPTIPAVSLGSFDKNAAGVDLSDVIEPFQRCLLGSNLEQNVFTSVESIFWMWSC